jgi:hypothetical protein
LRRLSSRGSPRKDTPARNLHNLVGGYARNSATPDGIFGVEVLKRIQPDMQLQDMQLHEAGPASAFDSDCDLIYATAVKAYGRGHKGSCDLIPADF